ncbi:MAG: hypothetical protein H6865_07970 [Rhodospirillales bacterium]|nr:hypothetical protein [Alphaproteobacteria bacterium]MCB9987552.1 hypothetical protein [Rhodospirillales bacterium]USO07727.1 MAG: hypothetical protein H6866_00380 [Rhodospirillales bacterium]
MTLNLKDAKYAKMRAGLFAMDLFATDAERIAESGAEDQAMVVQAEQVAEKLGISAEDALAKIGKERLPDGVQPFMTIKKGLLPKGFMAQENDSALRIQAALRIIHTLDGTLEPDASYDPKIFPDTPDAVAMVQNAFKSVLARKMPGVVAPPKSMTKHNENDIADDLARDIAWDCLRAEHEAYKNKPGREKAAVALSAFLNDTPASRGKLDLGHKL